MIKPAVYDRRDRAGHAKPRPVQRVRLQVQRTHMAGRQAAHLGVPVARAGAAPCPLGAWLKQGVLGLVAKRDLHFGKVAQLMERRAKKLQEKVQADGQERH